jgi:hypothetical protein
MRGVEMESCVLAPVGPHEADLKRKRVNQVELSPHDLAATRLLGLLHGEAASIKRKHV